MARKDKHDNNPEKDPEVTLENITPETADQWLQHTNLFNRPIRPRHVEKLQGAIERGEWQLTGDPIRFAPDGTLLDGQHRLWACVLADKPIRAYVIRGLPKTTVEVIDTSQATRNLRDQLRMKGFKDPQHLATAVNWKWRFDNGLVRQNTIPTITQGLAVLEDHPQLAYGECLSVGHRWQRRLGGSPSVVALAYYEFSQVDEEATETFFNNLIEGTGMRSGSPLLAMRRHMEAGKPGSVAMFALLIKAWNAYIEGREVHKLSWRPVGKNPEEFPKISRG